MMKLGYSDLKMYRLSKYVFGPDFAVPLNYSFDLHVDRAVA